MGSGDLSQYIQRSGASGGGQLATAVNFFAIVLMLSLIVLVVIVIIRLLQNPGFPHHAHRFGGHPQFPQERPIPTPPAAPSLRPETLKLLDILSERYARGEIDDQEYAAMKEEFLRRDAQSQTTKF